MGEIGVGNAPCSWGVLEFEGVGGAKVPYGQMLDELVAAGYTGTELGDWGYLPTDPETLGADLRHRELVILGAFLPVALRDPDAHRPGEEAALRLARLLAMVAGEPAPHLVLADNNAIDPLRTQHAGRITPAMGLDADGWATFAQGVQRIARLVRDDTGLRTAFHHHCAGYVETPEEIARLLDLTDPDLVGLTFDTGHYAYGSGGDDVVAGLQRYGDRIWYVHLKDCDPTLAARARRDGWDYLQAVERGLFCELGRGGVPFAAAVDWLHARAYRGYVVVEQDVLPGMGTPLESAQRNRAYLRGLGL